MSLDTSAPAATDSSDADLYAAAAAADAGQPVPDLAPSEPAAEQPTTTEASPAADAPATTSKTADERAEQEATEQLAAQDKPAAKPADAKPETPYAKAQKEAERRDRSWKALEAEKAEIRAKQAEYAKMQQELAELRQRVTQPPAPAKPAVDENGIDATTYDRLAKQYAEEGNESMAAMARKQAASLRSKEAAAPGAAAPAAAEATPPHTRPEFQAKWREHTAALVQAEPDLAKPDHPVVQAANALLADKAWGRFFLAHPDGITAAVQVAKLQQQAAQAIAASKELATARQEIARLTKLTSPRGSHPASAIPADRNPADLSDADVHALAAAADRGELGG